MLLAAFSQYFFGIAIFLTSTFLVLLVLVQRGRGGGLTGALGGPGGQSAFGTKAGDLFTRITIGVAAAWIFLCAAAVVSLKSRGLPTIVGGSTTSANSGSLGAGLSNPTTSSGTTSDAGGTISSNPTAPTIDAVDTTPAGAQGEITEFPAEGSDAESTESEGTPTTGDPTPGDETSGEAQADGSGQ